MESTQKTLLVSGLLGFAMVQGCHNRQAASEKRASPDRQAEMAQVGSGTPLHAAAEMGDVAEVERLLAGGADPNLRNWLDKTPLHLAARSNQVEVVAVLLEKGADADAVGPLGWRTLHTAAEWNNVEVVRLLLEHGADVSVKTESGGSPLDLAVPGSECAELLRKHGAKEREALPGSQRHGSATAGSAPR
jgi:ankyrin repeat protein